MIKTTFLKKILLSVILSTFYFFYSYSQNNENECKVLNENLTGYYEGGCKNGLAHGKGTAKGVDVYIGKFKEGLPHGSGKYIWKDGNYYEGKWKEGKRSGKGKMCNSLTKEEILGIWKDDKFVKKITERPYEITRQTGITGVSIQEKTTATPGLIEFIFIRDGSESRTIGGLMTESSSGIQKSTNYFTGFDNVEFPFKGSVRFRAPNRFNTVMVEYELKFEIKKESSWVVRIRY